MKQVITIPNLQVIEEQMGICEVEDHFFHHEADAHGRRGVLLGGRGEKRVSGVSVLAASPLVPPVNGGCGLSSSLWRPHSLKCVSRWAQGDNVAQLLGFHFCLFIISIYPHQCLNLHPHPKYASGMAPVFIVARTTNGWRKREPLGKQDISGKAV